MTHSTEPAEEPLNTMERNLQGCKQSCNTYDSQLVMP
jgi:hypothetical protein